MKFGFSVVFILALLFSFNLYAAMGILPGDGTAASPYLIEDMADFQTFCSDGKYNDLNINTKLTVDLDLAGQVRSSHFVGHSNKNYNGYRNSYFGSFDGGGHIISNLRVVNTGGTTASQNISGLFQVIGPGGVVKNLTLKNGLVYVKSFDVGLLCGRNWGLIENCHVSGMVRAASNCSVGLLAGNNGYDSGAIIRNCSVSGIVVQENTGDFAGGLCGSNEALIENCYVMADVYGNRYVGGFTGWNNTYLGEIPGQIINCYAIGSVTGTSHYVGGFCGMNVWNISNCYSAVKVNGPAGSSSIGGFVGNNSGTYNGCFWDADIAQLETSQTQILTGVEGKTTVQMNDINTFIDAGWNIVPDGQFAGSNVWVKSAGKYPKFTWSDPADTAVILDTETLIGLTEPEALAILASNGVTASIKYDCSSMVPAGCVILCESDRILCNATEICVLVSTGVYDWDTNPGAGTSDDPYQISTPGMLLGDIGVDGCYYRLESDLDLKYYSFNRGCVVRSDLATFTGFSGVFDGNGYVVRNVYIKNTENNQALNGFFRMINENGMVKNLGVENVFVYANLSDSSLSVGAMAGVCYGSCYNCYAKGTVNAISYYTTQASCGSFAGYGKGIANCYSDVNLYSNFDGYCGGFVGRGYDITNCYCLGNLTSGATDKFPGGFIGSVLNSSTKPVRNCFTAMKLVVSGSLVNGFIGKDVNGILGAVINCFWDCQAVGVGTAGTVSNGASAKTTVQMKVMGTYANASWDFVDETANGIDDIWYMPDNDYPGLLGLTSFGYRGTNSCLMFESQGISSLNIEIYGLAQIQQSWEIDYNCSWIVSVSPLTGGTSGSNDSTNVTIFIDPSGLPVGKHSTELLITNQNRIRTRVPLELTVFDPIDITDMQELAWHWLESDCIEGSPCYNVDYFRDGNIDLRDFGQFAQNWMKQTVSRKQDLDYIAFAHWSLDETSGTIAADNSEYNNPGTVYGIPAYSTGVKNGCYVFDGDDYIVSEGCQGIAGSQPRTVAAWIKADADLANDDQNLHCVVSWGSPESGSMAKWFVSIDDVTGKLALGIYGARLVATGSNTLEDGQWHHIAVVMPNGATNINQVKMFIDGAKVATNAAGLNAVINTAFSEVTIGAMNNSTIASVYNAVQHFKGCIDDVRIYNTALSAAELAELAQP